MINFREETHSVFGEINRFDNMIELKAGIVINTILRP